MGARQVSFQAFKAEFASRVYGIGRVLALMAPWHAPTYIKRVWCNFELYTALTTAEVEVHMLMPPTERERLFENVRSPQGLSEGP